MALGTEYLRGCTNLLMTLYFKECMAITKMTGRGESYGGQVRAMFPQLMPVAYPVPPPASRGKEPFPWLVSKKLKRKLMQGTHTGQGVWSS